MISSGSATKLARVRYDDLETVSLERSGSNEWEEQEGKQRQCIHVAALSLFLRSSSSGLNI